MTAEDLRVVFCGLCASQHVTLGPYDVFGAPCRMENIRFSRVPLVTLRHTERFADYLCSIRADAVHALLSSTYASNHRSGTQAEIKLEAGNTRKPARRNLTLDLLSDSCISQGWVRSV